MLFASRMQKVLQNSRDGFSQGNTWRFMMNSWHFSQSLQRASK